MLAFDTSMRQAPRMLRFRTVGGVPRRLDAAVRRAASRSPIVRALARATDPIARPYAAWVQQEEARLGVAATGIHAHIARLPRWPLVSVVMPVFDTPERLLREAIASVRAQWWPSWELCIADDASPGAHVARVLREAAAEEPRIRWMRRETNGHISAASNSALALARGEWVALLDHDDLLPPHALLTLMEAALAAPEAAVLFSDEDRIDEAGDRFDPYFKPGFDPDLLLGQNLLNHLIAYRRELLLALNGWREGLEGSQDHDLALRALAAVGPQAVRHVPGVLYHWRRRVAASFSDGAMERCVAHARRAIAEHLSARGHADARVEPSPTAPLWNRIRWALPTPAPAVSLILAGRRDETPAPGHIEALLARTALRPAEILVPTAGRHRPADLPQARLLGCGAQARWAEQVNAAAQAAAGTVLVLLGPQPHPMEPDWLEELVAQALRPGVGAAGGLLLDADGRVRQAEIALGGPALAEPAWRAHRADRPGYRGALALTRRVGALGGDCLAIRRSLFLQIGGVDAALPDAAAVLDLSFRIRAAGLALVFSPFARLRDPSAGLTGHDMASANLLRQRWGAMVERDPARSVLLDLKDGRPVLTLPAATRTPARAEA